MWLLSWACLRLNWMMMIINLRYLNNLFTLLNSILWLFYSHFIFCVGVTYRMWIWFRRRSLTWWKDCCPRERGSKGRKTDPSRKSFKRDSKEMEMSGEQANTIGTSKTPQRKGNNAPFGYIFFRNPPFMQPKADWKGWFSRFCWTSFIHQLSSRMRNLYHPTGVHVLSVPIIQIVSWTLLFSWRVFPERYHFFRMLRLNETRKMLRSTAKDTIVNGKSITSWLIRQSCSTCGAFLIIVGPVPIMRPKDHLGQKVDNTDSFRKLIEVWVINDTC